MKKIKSALSVLFVVAMTLTLYASVAFAVDFVGNGTPESPLQIGTEEQLLEFGKRVMDGETDLYAVLTDNIPVMDWTVTDSDDTNYSSIGKRDIYYDSASTTPYEGVFDGKNFTLTLSKTAITTDTNDRDNIALFHTIGADGVVRNLNLDVDFSGYRIVAGAAAKNYGTIENVTVNAAITASHTTGYAAGIAGMNYGTIENAAVSGSISGNYAGGIAGLNGCTFVDSVLVPGRIIKCLNEADVTGNRFIGGIAGSFLGEMSRCRNTGTVSGNIVNGQCGGLLSIGAPGSPAQKRFIVSDCYNAGTVKGSSGIHSALFGGSAAALADWRDYEGEYEDFKVSNVFVYGAVPPHSNSLRIVAVLSLSTGAIDFTPYDITKIFANTYYREGMGTKLFGQDNLNVPDGFGNKYVKSVIKKKTDEEFARAEMAALLNNGRTGANAPWEYVAGSDYPTLKFERADYNPDDDGSDPVSGGGGCDAGAAGMAVLAALGMATVARRRSR